MRKLLVYALIVLHVAFIAIVVLGGVGALLWRSLAWVHVPVLLWAFWVEWMQWQCPLTHWENALRRRASMPTYNKGFVHHYMLHPVFGEQLPAKLEFLLTLLVVALNLLVYLYLAFFT